MSFLLMSLCISLSVTLSLCCIRKPMTLFWQTNVTTPLLQSRCSLLYGFLSVYVVVAEASSSSHHLHHHHHHHWNNQQPPPSASTPTVAAAAPAPAPPTTTTLLWPLWRDHTHTHQVVSETTTTRIQSGEAPFQQARSFHPTLGSLKHALHQAGGPPPCVVRTPHFHGAPITEETVKFWYWCQQ